jgi:hypothetical protein
LSGEGGDPGDLLDAAFELLRLADPGTAGLWPRAAALLALEALETGLRRQWQRQSLELAGCAMRTQLICLRSYLEDAPLAARTSHAWAALTRACHHHAYELAPTVTELQSWFIVVRDLIGKSSPARA